MIKFIIGLFIFCIVLFIYLHIQFHLKTSNDLEIYEVDECSKEKLEEICDIRQPVLFDLDSKKIIANTNFDYIINLYSAFEIKIRNRMEDDINSELYIPLSLDSAKKLFHEDKQSIYISENNDDFLQETGVIKNFSYNDDFLRPYMVSNCIYDIIMGSSNVNTVFKYEVNYRNYFILTQGSAQIKLAPPSNSKYLFPIYDYENFEFKSPVDPWNPQPKYRTEFDKIKCLEFTLLPGKTLFIPSFWWYSIRLNSEETSISCFKYKTYMNNVSILPYLFMYGLQMQNIKRNTNKKKVTFEDEEEEEINKKNVEIKKKNKKCKNIEIYNNKVNFDNSSSLINEIPIIESSI